jgi:hypothetical protein
MNGNDDDGSIAADSPSTTEVEDATFADPTPTPTPTTPARVRWTAKPDPHDYPAAASYLSLIADAATVKAVVKRLKHAESVEFKVKDVLRASRLPLLAADDPEVVKDLARIAAGTPLSPCLIVRGRAEKDQPAQIADGYHRVCASYHHDEDTVVIARIVDL